MLLANDRVVARTEGWREMGCGYMTGAALT